jgi:hypothetical protein
LIGSIRPVAALALTEFMALITNTFVFAAGLDFDSSLIRSVRFAAVRFPMPAATIIHAGRA